MSMPAATVLIPTHAHVEPLRFAVASAQEQTIEDIEIFVVGDGVGDATRAVVADLALGDRRIRFFDFPKGPSQGEIHRQAALQHATGRIVAYLGDDDYWMPNHLMVLSDLLLDADFGHTMHVGVNAGGELFVYPADLQNPDFRARVLSELYNPFDLTFGGHTLAAYRRLPHGWRTTPPDCPWTDLSMWRQFLAEPWCRVRSAMVPTCICTQTHLRPQLSDRERAEDLARWREELAKPDFREKLWRTACKSFAQAAVRHESQALRGWAASAQHESHAVQLQAEVERLQDEAHHLQAAYAQLKSDLVASQASDTSQSAQWAAQLAAMRSSTSWRVTRPLRDLRQAVSKIIRP